MLASCNSTVKNLQERVLRMDRTCPVTFLLEISLDRPPGSSFFTFFISRGLKRSVFTQQLGCSRMKKGLIILCFGTNPQGRQLSVSFALHVAAVPLTKSPRAASLAANTGSGCAGAGVLSRPRVSACVCVCLCRSSGRPWEPNLSLPEPGAAAGGRRTPHMRGSLCRHWPAEGAVRRRLALGWSQTDAERREEPRRTEWTRSRCALIGRTTGGRCPG